MIWRLLTFVGATLAIGLAAALVIRGQSGDEAAIVTVIAMAVCLVPGAITLVLTEVALKWSPQVQVTAVLGGTGIRIFVVLIAAFALYRQVPWLGDESGFISWVIIYYFVTLALEVALVLRAQAVTRKPEQAAGRA